MHKIATILLVSTATAVLAAPAAAQQVEEIVVTAQKRSESLQKVPIAVTAITGRLAQSAGVRTTQDLQMVVPGITIERQSAAATVFLRGVGTTGGQAGQENAVAVFVDGVYQPSMNAALFSLTSVERVEVLKGPQGTLYGRNATGGAINVVTRDPSRTPELKANIGYGNLNTIEGDLYASTALGEDLAGDFAFYYHNQQDGFGHSIVTGADVNKSRDLAARGKLLFTPGDSTRITLIGSYGKTVSSYGLSYRPTSTAVTVDGQKGFPYGFFDTRGNYDPNTSTNQWSVSGNIEQQLGFANLTSITAYQELKTYFSTDFDLTALPLVNVKNHQTGRTFTQELQLGSLSGSRIKWILGLYYFKDMARYDPFNLGGLAFAPGTDIVYDPDRQRTRSYATFAQATAPLFAETNLTVGLRYTIDRRKLNAAGSLLLPGGAAVPLFPEFQRSNTAKKLSWRLALDHSFTPDVLGYISYNRGFKSGVYNLTAPTDPVVNPEVLDAYEAGLKTSLFDRRLRLNGALFLYQYKGLQLSKFTSSGASLVNAAQARIYGLDLDFEAAPAHGLTLSGGMEYLHARYTRFPDAPFTFINPAGGNSTEARDATGHHLLRAPTLVGNIAATYTVDMARGAKLSLNATYNYNDGFYWEPDNRLRQKAYNLVNTRATWTAPSGQWSLALWSRNLTNTHYYEQVGGIPFGDLATAAPGRTFGGSVGVSF